MKTNLVYLKDGKAWTDSVKLAAEFDKRHDHVMAKIEKQVTEYSPEFVATNFSGTTYEAPTNGEGVRDYKMFRLSRDGFMAVAMTFTGKKAAAFRETVLAEFNRMEAQLVDVGLMPKELTINDLLKMTANKLQEAVDYAVDFADEHTLTAAAIIKRHTEPSKLLIEATKPHIKNLAKYGNTGILTVGLQRNGIKTNLCKLTTKGPAKVFNTKEIDEFMSNYKGEAK